jgi:hypothetical protein
MGENLCSYTSDQVLITRIYRELKKLNSQRTNDPMKKWANLLIRSFSKEKCKWPKKKKHMKTCTTSLAIKEMQIKTTLRFHIIFVRMAVTKNTAYVGEDVEKEEHCTLFVGM